ncbi:MAG: hypothetical protein M3P48_07780 [Actinomycetota bacterium]|nr:hypothetical protein [Actinomycetota bacterium]
MSESSIDDASGLDRPVTGDPGADIQADVADLASTIGPLGGPDDVERPTSDTGGADGAMAEGRNAT